MQYQQRFSQESNIHYRIDKVESLTLETLKAFIIHHREFQKPRIDTLRNYYKGDNEFILINKRRREDHLADNRATHNFAKYVSQFIQGYLMGVPLKTNYPDEKVNELLRDINRDNDADEHNSDLVLDQSIYGRAYELIYRDQQDKTRFVVLDPSNTFVIYDETVECKPLAAIRRVENKLRKKTTIYVYTDKAIITYNLNDSNDLTLTDEEPHHFGGVPIIEYENNKYRQGDFEDVLSLIDLYDAAQSDTANYIQDLNDALLVIKGNLKIDTDKAKKMKENNILMLQTEQNVDGDETDADAFYIYKQYDVAGTEAYKERVFNNILLFTSIPNLLDDKKAGNQSGEALKMKLFALAQKRATKERLFKKSLRDRYRLINNLLTFASEGSIDVNEISITFTENLPSMIDKELEWFNAAGGELSQETLLANLSFVENPQEEMERIEAEKPKRSVYEFPKGGEENEEVE